MESIKNKYIFPDVLAKLMSKVNMQTQLEASMLSMSFMSLGLIISITYMFIYVSLETWYKWVLVINGIFGLMFMYSYIITSFNQYQNYMEVLEFQKQNENK